MNRTGIERKVNDLLQRIPSAIEANPQRACMLCFLLGMCFALMPRFFMSLFIVAAAVTVAAWFLAEDSSERS